MIIKSRFPPGFLILVMPVNRERYKSLIEELKTYNAGLVAVSKMKTVADIRELYELGQRDFGENYVQELLEKKDQLPADIRWHFIGHLQSNKVKYIIPFIHLIQGVDSLRLLKEIVKQGRKLDREVQVLLQVHIATEATKFGLDPVELEEVVAFSSTAGNLKVRGLMGMSSFTENESDVKAEFNLLKQLFDKYAGAEGYDTLSMGMSGDYRLALAEGSNLVRVGSLLFGNR